MPVGVASSAGICLDSWRNHKLATHKSALKAHRQSEMKRARNRTVRGGVRKAVKRTRSLVDEGDLDGARESLQVAISRLDRAAEKGVIHKNSAARHKSRLTKLLNGAQAASK